LHGEPSGYLALTLRLIIELADYSSGTEVAKKLYSKLSASGTFSVLDAHGKYSLALAGIYTQMSVTAMCVECSK
jgi:hypothetical protein